MPTTEPAVPMPSSHEPVPQRRPRGRRRTGAVALLGAIALAAGGTSAQASVGGSAPAASAAATLQSGSTGSAVRQLQRKLGLRADGHFGPRTRRALVRWQRRHGVRADGVAGPATLKALGIRARSSRAPAGGGAASPALERIAQCESGGNPTAVSANGRYHGKYQFSVATWRAMGGEGLPSQAAEAEQDRLASKLHASQGTAPWPVCGVRA